MKIKFELDKDEKKIIDYANKVLDYKPTKNINYKLDDIFGLIDELASTLEHTQEQLKDIEDDKQENYKRCPSDLYEEYGVSRSDFV